MWITILYTIGAIALSYGLQYIADEVEQVKANSRELNPSQIIGKIQTFIAKIRSKSMEASDALNEKLNRIPQIAAVGSLNDYLAKERAKLSNQKSEVIKKENAIQAMANSVESQANAFAYQPTSYKASKAGELELRRITQLARDLEGVSNELSKQVEKEI